MWKILAARMESGFRGGVLDPWRWGLCRDPSKRGARIYYDQRSAAGDSHHQALRALGNRLVGILHGCLVHHVAYDEKIAWGHRAEGNLQEAA